ncbi:hypothetical protein EFP51_02640 [Lactobacillus johnsonii]|uniref:hypothetical protein n=1 Tax=Lactobacillus johnsonii TaxID=33959 RepID=UPI0021A2CF7B|nr:hypothetical protein [Lactobacillus johnsonii]MCT3382241.1 hypothetical protein [Lactobacillus johnsonii]MCT3387271.1 hypothetical protein [Lactobacillus johnsonii]
MMYQFKDEKLKFEIKNNLNKMLTNNKMLANNKVKDIESITYEGSNIVSDKPAYFDISIRIKGYFEENETIILPKPLRLKESLLDKINEDKEKHGYKEIETMIVDALDNYYEGC